MRRIKIFDGLIWLIPLAFFLYFIWEARYYLPDVLEHGNSVMVWSTFFILILFGTVVMSFLPFLVCKIILRGIKTKMIKSSTFDPVYGLDYYREKLKGLSPGIISMITDLKIEQKKDVSACILKYQEMGILWQENGRYVAGDYVNDNRLQVSDRYLIAGLIHNTFNMEHDSEWQKLVEQEGIESGYLTKSISQVQAKENDNKLLGGCLFTVLTPIILIVAIVVLALHANTLLESLGTVVDNIPETISGFVEYARQYPELYPFLTEGILVIVLCMALFLFPIIAIAVWVGLALTVKRLRRTSLGNEMAEYIYGMKNFIHDYSNLSEAERQQVVMWEDYLIYAVVLEENQQIVSDIMRRRKIR